MRIKPLYLALALTTCLPLEAAQAQAVNSDISINAYTYADFADLTIDAPVVASATIRDAIRIKGAQAASLPPGQARFYVEADIVSLIRGTGGVPAQVNYVVDVPLDSRGRMPKLKRSKVLLAARRVPGNAASLQLVAADAQFIWSAGLENRLRAVVQAVTAANAPPVITRIGNAFHVAGTLPGEGETQIFLITTNNMPVSLSVLRRPGQQRAWAVALGEIVDEAAGPPQPDTLLWYRLACGPLPATLPAGALRDSDPASAAAAREDYRFVREQLGACQRNRPQR